MNMIRWSTMHVLFESQHDLGLEVDSFDNIGMSAASFFGNSHRKIIIFKNKKHQMKKII